MLELCNMTSSYHNVKRLKMPGGTLGCYRLCAGAFNCQAIIAWGESLHEELSRLG